MKKLTGRIFSVVLLLLVIAGSLGIYHFYGDEIIETIGNYLKIDNTKVVKSTYRELHTLLTQVDTNNNEIQELEKKIDENQLLMEEMFLNYNSENAKEIKKLEAVNEVFKNRVIDLEVENKRLENEITNIQNQLDLNQSQIDELRNQILEMETQLSQKATIEQIVQNFTFDQKTFSLPSGKKFSDYTVLYFVFEQTDTNKYASMSLPVDLFEKGNLFELSVGSTSRDRYMQFSYKSDTSYYIGANSYVEFRYIYGLKK